MWRWHYFAALMLGSAYLFGGLAYAKLSEPAPERITRQIMRRYEIPGAILAYGKVGSEPTITAFGDMRPDQVVPIASLAKTVTAERVMSLVDQGKLSLDQRVGPATIRQYLNHEGGYLTEHGCTGSAKPDFAPGTRSLYSNRNFCWLVTAIEQATGKPFRGAYGFTVHEQLARSRGGAPLKGDALALFRFFSRKPHPSNDTPVRPLPWMPLYRNGWAFDGTTYGHWGNIPAGQWGDGLLTVAVHTADNHVAVVLFNKRPENYKTLYWKIQRGLVRSL